MFFGGGNTKIIKHSTNQLNQPWLATFAVAASVVDTVVWAAFAGTGAVNVAAVAGTLADIVVVVVVEAVGFAGTAAAAWLVVASYAVAAASRVDSALVAAVVERRRVGDVVGLGTRLSWCRRQALLATSFP